MPTICQIYFGISCKIPNYYTSNNELIKYFYSYTLKHKNSLKNTIINHSNLVCRTTIIQYYFDKITFSIYIILKRIDLTKELFCLI